MKTRKLSMLARSAMIAMPLIGILLASCDGTPVPSTGGGGSGGGSAGGVAGGNGGGNAGGSAGGNGGGNAGGSAGGNGGGNAGGSAGGNGGGNAGGSAGGNGGGNAGGSAGGNGGGNAGGNGGGSGGGSAFPRTLITRSLMPTSPENLLRDPLIGGEGSGEDHGQLEAFYNDSAYTLIVMNRTFQSVSPVGGAVSIEQLGPFTPPAGATSAYLSGSVLGGSGAYHASIWISAGDAQGNPIPFASAASSIQVTLDTPNGAASFPLTASASGVSTFGNREWMQFLLTDDAAMPIGGFFDIALTDLTKTLQLAAPEVTSSQLGARVSGKRASAVAMSADLRRALAVVRARPHPNRTIRPKIETPLR